MSKKEEIKVLVVDDEDISRQNVVSFLKYSGYTVFEADNGLSGLEIFRKEKPTILLTDIRMPDLDGLQIL